jgi:hypothetical protein
MATCTTGARANRNPAAARSGRGVRAVSPWPLSRAACAPKSVRGSAPRVRMESTLVTTVPAGLETTSASAPGEQPARGISSSASGTGTEGPYNSSETVARSPKSAYCSSARASLATGRASRASRIASPAARHTASVLGASTENQADRASTRPSSRIATAAPWTAGPRLPASPRAGTDHARTQARTCPWASRASVGVGSAPRTGRPRMTPRNNAAAAAHENPWRHC